MRSIWKGALSFGLVNIPVRLYSATSEKELKFNLLHKKDHSEIRYARICKTDGKEIPWNEIVKGFEIKKGEYVILDDEDFKRVNLHKSKTIDIVSFVDEDQIDSVYYTKPYFLEPEKNAGHAYALLRDALFKSKKVGIAKYVLRNHEHLAVIKPLGDLIILNEMRYQSELLGAEDLELPQTTKKGNKELDMALKLIDQLTVDFQPAQYSDTYTDEVMAMIKQKAKGRPIHPKGASTKITKLHDIMSLLEASLEKKPRKKTHRVA